MSETMSSEQSGFNSSALQQSTTAVQITGLRLVDSPFALAAAALTHTPRGLGMQAEPGHWYVCFTKPRQEAYAATKLREQGYDFYLPMLDSWARRAGQWCKKQTVMFPRYAFVRPALAGQSIAPVRCTPGVSTLVRFGPVLATLAVDRLAALQAVLAERAAALPGQPLAVNQHVVFASGPLKGMAGIVSNVAAERVCVLMTLLGQQQSVVVSANELALQSPQELAAA